jgi:hypothetical protein
LYLPLPLKSTKDYENVHADDCFFLEPTFKLPAKFKQMSTKHVTIKVTEEQEQFLNLIMYGDAATSKAGAVIWCIDSCMKIEETYNVDACYVGYNDIRLPENNPVTA